MPQVTTVRAPALTLFNDRRDVSSKGSRWVPLRVWPWHPHGGGTGQLGSTHFPHTLTDPRALPRGHWRQQGLSARGFLFTSGNVTSFWFHFNLFSNWVTEGTHVLRFL